MKHLISYAIALVVLTTAVMADSVRPQPRPDIFPTENCQNRGDEDQCLRCSIYHEARGEGRLGQLAVAIVKLNRVASNQYPNTICNVVWQKGYNRRAERWVAQFTWTLDGMSDRVHEADAWIRAGELADEAIAIYLSGGSEELLAIDEDVLWYHTDGVRPSWSRSMTAEIMHGSHIFFSNS